MHRPPEYLEESFRACGLSPAYAKRMVVELRDHLECATREHIKLGLDQDTASRLAQEQVGHDDLILERLISDPSCLVLPHRHPFLSFLVGPIVAIGILLALYVSIASPAGRWTVHVFGLDVTDPRFHTLAFVSYLCAGYLLWVAAALGVCAVAHRYRCGIKWSRLGCLTIATVAGLCFVYIRLPVGDTGTEFAAYGMDLASRIPRVILPLVVFAIFAGYQRWSKASAIVEGDPRPIVRRV